MSLEFLDGGNSALVVGFLRAQKNHTRNGANHEKTPIFSELPIQCFHYPSALLQLMCWRGLTRNKLFQLMCDLHDHFLATPPSLSTPCPKNPQNFSLEKTRHFSVETRQARPQASFRGENWRILRWIFGQKSAGFCWIFRCGRRRNFRWGRWSWRFGKGTLLNHALFRDAQITSRCNYKNRWFFHVLFCPHLSAGFCLFEVRGVVVWALRTFSRDQYWGLQHTIFKGTSEPQK